MTATASRPRRLRARVSGTVQGVGFRPYVYRLAGELGLSGFVLNDSRGVLIEVEGGRRGLSQFFDRLTSEAPPLAVVERLETEEVEATGESTFVIRSSPRGGVPDAPVTPDTATCPECLAEVLDPADRRFRYPFTNCTNCGPRFTIVQGVPYDRPRTTMAGFAMCERCAAEYADPANRRFHAQPNACPVCGPSVWLAEPGGGVVATGGARDYVEASAEALLAGRIVAIKGVGGFHLACRADDEDAVSRLRARKHREDKPFALMVDTVEQARRLVELNETERDLLCAPERPIVLAPRRPGAPVAGAVAPGAPELGLMLPYSPLHHLLLADSGRPLVMTSGNVSDEPIAYSNEDALARLAGIADLFLLHDRPIATRTDDSVLRVIGDGGARRRVVLRRSRGHVPAGLALPCGDTPLLACGAELKSTFCVARGGRAWVSHHIGDLQNYETLRSFREGVEHFQRLFAVMPEVLVHDLHPEYLSTKYALERDAATPGGHDVELVGVQHHHAHLAACLAEHGNSGPAVGAIFDGTGYGTDGTVWGGELLFGDAADFRRVGSLWPVRLPGGDRAIREPWRMACSWLVAAEAEPPPGLVEQVDAATWRAVRRLATGGLASPVTTSMGRLFDAVAALCGIRPRINYEGQAAIELEAACDPSERGSYPVSVGGSVVDSPDDRLLIDPREMIRLVVRDVTSGASPAIVSARFHNAIARATVEACCAAASVQGTDTVVLSGGVFQNRRLLESVLAGLSARGLGVLIPERLPLGDGGISYGQAAVAARRMASREGG